MLKHVGAIHIFAKCDFVDVWASVIHSKNKLPSIPDFKKINKFGKKSGESVKVKM